MKALSLTRPWTWLVLHGGKNIENRVWQTGHTGTVLVHGAKSIDLRAAAMFLDLLTPEAFTAYANATAALHQPAYWTGLLGTVDVTGCCTAQIDGRGHCDCGPWAMPDQAHWQLTNPRPFTEPIPCNGALGLWTPGPHLHEAITTAIGAPA